MKKKFSRTWLRSKQPRKQRKYRYNAPLHIRQKFISVHLDKKLRTETKRRTFPVRKADEVMILRGEFKKKTGKVTKVDLKKVKIFIDNVKKKKGSGQEIEIPIEPSNLMITKLNFDDKKRRKLVERKQKVNK